MNENTTPGLTPGKQTSEFKLVAAVVLAAIAESLRGAIADGEADWRVMLAGAFAAGCYAIARAWTKGVSP